MKYEVLEYERQLLGSNISTSQLGILQRNSTTRLKEKLENKTMLYHSSNEEDEQLRIIVFGLLVKFFRCYSLSNQRNMNRLKDIVYHSSLSPKITTQQGIEPAQLFKYFAIKINELIINEGADQVICNLMNTEVFFQEIIFAALRNKIGARMVLQKEDRLELICSFLKEEFGLTVSILKCSQKAFEENDDQLVFYMFNGHLHKLCPERKERKSSESSISRENISRVQNLSPVSYKEETIRIDNSGNYNDISPLLFSAKTREIPTSEKKIKPFDPYSSGKKRKIDKQKRGIFQLFCCCE